MLDQANFRPTSWPRMKIEYIHERPDQQNATSGLAQNVFRCQRVRKRVQIETLALIPYDHGEIFVRALDFEVNFLLITVAVAVYDGVDHALAHSHPNLGLFIFVEAGLVGLARNQCLRLIDAL